MNDELAMEKSSSEYLAASSHSTTEAGYGEELEPTDEEVKLQEIKAANERQDFGALVTLAISAGGLLQDHVRKDAWPILLGSWDTPKIDNEWRDLPPHQDEHQVQLDVDRSFIYYPNNQSSQNLERRKSELSDLITGVLRRYPFLHYFQGFHDICQVFLLVLGFETALSCVSRLCLTRIRDFMLPSLSPALSHLMLLPDIVRAEDTTLWRHLSQTQPFFALSATLTLYAHDIQAYGDIARLFDVILAREPVFSIYLFARIILERKDELLDIPPDEPEMIHSVLNKVPQSLDLDELVSKAVALQERHPPKTLRAWKQISRHSVLKTAKDAEEIARQSLEDGAALFRKQDAELRFAEMSQKAWKSLQEYQRPALTIGLAIFVGLVAWRMRYQVW
ncbi:MAG: Eukaryotic translation initiation factor 5A [Watsoniomyces obsoletus]|nr:MAG: Eukaryotic translation initiation factor 5A [Watsoniomyces obsoletus]